MSFLGPAAFTKPLKSSSLQKKPEKQAVIPKRKGVHPHKCQDCGFAFKCSIEGCTMPDEVMQCYHCKPSNFEVYKKA